jgi:hypothetical protein
MHLFLKHRMTAFEPAGSTSGRRIVALVIDRHHSRGQETFQPMAESVFLNSLARKSVATALRMFTPEPAPDVNIENRSI